MGHATTSLALGIALALGATACSGIDAGVDYPNDLPSDLGSNALTPENGPDPSVAFSRFKFSPEACKGIDTRTIIQPLGQDDLSRFLETQGVKIAAKKA